METILDIYSRPYDADYPVICFDERPCQLIEEILTPLLPAPGRTARHDYHYKRNGTCAILLAVEPLTGKRIVEVSIRKTKADYARFMKKLVKSYPNAKKIILVQDNLNTHDASSFYENMQPESAFQLMSKFEMKFTPKKASWLNMAEIDFAAISKQCLNRRIGDIKSMTKEVTLWTKERIRKKVKINWQFSIGNAREKFEKHYSIIKKN